MSSFTNTQLTNFFTSTSQMGLTTVQRNALRNEGLESVEDFEDFKENEIKMAIKNVRQGIPTIPGIPAIPEQRNTRGSITRSAIAATPAIQGTPPVLIPARSASRLYIASIAYHYYNDTSREVTPTNMHYSNVLKDFYIEWQALEQMEKQDSPKLPTLSKINTPLKWCESFKHYLYSTFGVRKIPLTYVIREKVSVVPESGNDPNGSYDPLQTNKSYGNSGSVLGDLIDRASHSHPLFKSDNATVFGAIEAATRGTVYSTTVKPFARKKDGRGAWLALLTSHVGTDKWEKIQKDNSSWLVSAKWNGKKYSLDSFISQHRGKYQQLVEASHHVKFQLPNEHTRVSNLIDSIENSDAALQAAIANIRQNTNGMRDDFEKAAAVLLPVDPYVKNISSRKSISFQISSLGRANSFGRGEQTGVDLRWYKADEYAKLKPSEKKELSAWQQTDEGRKHIATERKAYHDSKKRLQDRDGAKSNKKNRFNSSAVKQSAEIAALKKELSTMKEKGKEDAMAAEVAALLNTPKTNKAPNNETMSVARQVMAIVARNKNDE